MRSSIMFLLAATPCAAAAALAPDLAKPPPNAKICKTERSLSSRIVRQTCKTAAEWRQDSMSARDKLKLGAKSQTTEAFKAPSGQ